ncbi:MAG: hypothetical protein AB7J30_00570 [Hyphomicrobium sp.]|uniref:hypothetical protein n=1 Tax=Hyphomicrobium sp. TaxID=82 RepID=UPI003D0A0E41
MATRAALTSHFVDRAIAAIEGKKPSSIETAQSCWLLTAATLVLAGGVALLFLLDVAAWLFVASAVGQALYLFVLAPSYFDRVDPPDPAGRGRSTNAFWVYLLATALVLWAQSGDRLMHWEEASRPALLLPSAVVAAHVAYVVWTIASAPAPAPLFAMSRSVSEVAGAAGADASQSQAIKVMADYYAHPLWAMDDGLYGDFPPERLGVSEELASDLNAWAEAFTFALDPEQPGESRWSEEQLRAHDAEARALALRLARERPDRTIYVMDRASGDPVEIKPGETI